MKPLFRQLFDEKTWTYTYIIGDPQSGKVCIIDPVRDQVERDLRIMSELGLNLTYILDTHIHADHITGSGVLRAKTGAKIAMGVAARIAKPDILLADGEILKFGNIELKALATPGHTEGCTSFFIDSTRVSQKQEVQGSKGFSKGVYGDVNEQEKSATEKVNFFEEKREATLGCAEIRSFSETPMIFTGDALLIRKTGRTDFQGGSAVELYHSIKEKIYTLPDETRIFPGHDYTGQTMSTVGEEKAYNTRIRGETTVEDFKETMANLHLPYPKYLDVALPANLKLGIE